MAIQYSDGHSIERRILRILEGTNRLDSSLPIARHLHHEWPIRYHLCPERANLVRHLNFKGLDVLELGAGMGAVSRFLAEKSQSLTLVEGTDTRFQALQARLRGLTNWTGQVSNIQSARFEKRFDVVCLIGVLEYSELYITPDPGKSPFHTLLRIAKEQLRPGGVLLLAIENRLGLKYWNGSAEDHTAKLFDGICNYPLTQTPRTFSQKELQTLLNEVGFSQIDKHYPFPDYKIPRTVISSQLMTANPTLSADLATTENFQHYIGSQKKLFPDSLAMASLSSAGLLEEFANSFLCIATDTTHSPIRNSLLERELNQQQVGWHYSLDRRIPTETIFTLSPQNQIHASKLSTAGLKETQSDGVQWNGFLNDPIATGQPLKRRWAQHLHFGNKKQFETELLDFLVWSFVKWETNPSNLDGKAVDAVYINAVKTDSGYDLFDLEWSVDTIEKSWFVLRNLLLLDRLDLYLPLCQQLSIPPQLEKDLCREARFQTATSTEPDVAAHLRNLGKRANCILKAPTSSFAQGFYQIEAKTTPFNVTIAFDNRTETLQLPEKKSILQIKGKVKTIESEGVTLQKLSSFSILSHLLFPKILQLLFIPQELKSFLRRGKRFVKEKQIREWIRSETYLLGNYRTIDEFSN